MYDVIPFICFELTELTRFFTIFLAADIFELFSAILFCLEVYLTRLSAVVMVLTYNCGYCLVITVLFTYLGGYNAISLDLEVLS